MKFPQNIKRNPNGVPQADVVDEKEMYYAMGVIHATDRAMQMILMRILGQGRAAELLDGTDAFVEIDTFFRRMNWSSSLDSDLLKKLPPAYEVFLNAYCQGVNSVWSKKIPWECKLLGYKPEPWRPEDSLTISRMIGYLTLAQSQGEVETLFIEMVQAGMDRERLTELFGVLIKDADFDLIKQVKLQHRQVRTNLWEIGLPRMMASNNWVISGSLTKSGKPILANDPHLETNRLPAVWCEMILRLPNRYAIAFTMPGVPGVLLGRTNDLAWGATYTFMDAQDHWIEKIKDGKFYREDKGYIDFRVRKELIQRKKGKPVEAVFYENDHGVLLGDPTEDGYLLSTRWSGSESGISSLTAVFEVFHAKDVESGRTALGKLESSWNFVIADNIGNIGYQMTGLMPLRSEGVLGFAPMPGWQSRYDWQGFVKSIDLPRALNPKEGFIVTANNDLNHLGRISPINMPMGSYRADRIAELIQAKKDLTVKDIQSMHMDVYSRQAALFMSILRPLLPQTPQGKILKEWDCSYNAESEGAGLFEKVYRQLYIEVFGKKGMGESVVRFLWDEAGIFIDFYDRFDRILLSESSIWFGSESRDAIFSRAAKLALENVDVKKWKKLNSIILTNIVLGGKLPRFLGFDHGPVPIIGGRATVHQGQIYRSAGRTTSFTPSLRMITEFTEDAVYSCLSGGPSDRRFSKWYISDLDNWRNGKYKKLDPHSSSSS